MAPGDAGDILYTSGTTGSPKGVFAVSSEELPARVFLTYFTRKSAFKRFGFHPECTIGLWRALAAAITRDGGQVRLATEVASIAIRDGQVTEAVLRHSGGAGGGTEVARARFVVSDIGPAVTVRLAPPGSLLVSQFRRPARPAAR